MFKVAIR